MGTKLTLEFVKEEYSKKGYEFLDDFYKNNEYKHNIKCLTCGNVWKQVYSSFQQGIGCPKCARQKQGERRKLTLEFVKEEYSKKNYGFLDDFYESCRYKHNIKCLTCNHEWEQSYDSFQQEHGCPKCARQKQGERQKYSLDFIKQEYSKRNYEFLDDFYKNNEYKHNIKCLTCGYVWKQRYGDLQQDHGCPRCVDFTKNNDKKNDKIKNIEKNIEKMTLLEFDAELLLDLMKKGSITYYNSVQIYKIGSSQFIKNKLENICNKKISNTNDLKECLLMILKQQKNFYKIYIIQKTIGFYIIANGRSSETKKIKTITINRTTSFFSKILDCCDFLEYEIKNKALKITKGTLLLDGEWVGLGYEY